MEKLLTVFAKACTGAILIIGTIAIGSILAALPVKWTWNGVMPAIFNLEEITFLQAFCLCWLSGALVKSNVSK